MEIIAKSTSETKRTAALLAKKIKEKLRPKRALIIALEGDLGSGKTTFVQGLAEELGVRENVLSPTFVIQKDFPLNFSAQGGPAVGWKNLYHIDVYRLKNSKELLDLGFRDLTKNPENLIVIEWADKIKKILPKNIMKIKFFNLGKNQRKISIL